MPTPADGDWTAATLGLIDRRVRVAALSNCHWTNGARDLVTIGDACRAAGAALVLDLTQSLGAMPLTWRRSSRIFSSPPATSGSRARTALVCCTSAHVGEKRGRWKKPGSPAAMLRHFTALVNYSDVYRPGSRRFDCGETCTTTILPGAIAALEQLQAWGVVEVARTLAAINGKIQAQVETRPALSCCRRPSVARTCSARACRPCTPAISLVRTLHTHNVFISQRGPSVRFSPHLHVTDADLSEIVVRHVARRPVQIAS